MGSSASVQWTFGNWMDMYRSSLVFWSCCWQRCLHQVTWQWWSRTQVIHASDCHWDRHCSDSRQGLLPRPLLR